MLAARACVALSSSERRKGLLGREGFDEFDALLISPCEAVHTFGMRFPIDIVFLDRQKRVRRTCENVEPGRIRLDLFARSVLELPVGTIRRTCIRAGSELAFSEAEDEVTRERQ